MEMIECNIFQERLHDLSGERQERGGKKKGKYAASCSYFVLPAHDSFMCKGGERGEGRKTHMCAELVELQVDFGKRKLI